MPESANPESASLIMLQFLAWVVDRPRTYAGTMEAWRTTCPRLSVWEDAVIEGLVRIEKRSRSCRALERRRGHAVLEKAKNASALESSALSLGTAKLLGNRIDDARIHRLDLGGEHCRDVAVAADQIFVEIPFRRLARPLAGAHL